MANLTEFWGDDFDDRAVAASKGIPDPVPPGEYLLQVGSTELVATKDGTGMMLKTVLDVVTGEFEGRKIFPQFNVRNKSAQAQTIGIGEFKALCLACGVDYEVARLDTDALLHKPFRALVDYEKEQINPTTGQPYAPKNRIKKYIPAGEAKAPAPAAVAKPAASVGAAVKPATPQAGLPWKKAG